MAINSWKLATRFVGAFSIILGVVFAFGGLMEKDPSIWFPAFFVTLFAFHMVNQTYS